MNNVIDIALPHLF